MSNPVGFQNVLTVPFWHRWLWFQKETGILLNRVFTEKEEFLGAWSLGVTLATVTVNNEVEDPESRKQSHNRLTALHFQTGLLSDQPGKVSKGPVLERSPGELVDFHGSPPTSSRMVFTGVQRIKQRWQEACTDKQNDSDWAQMQKGLYKDHKHDPGDSEKTKTLSEHAVIGVRKAKAHAKARTHFDFHLVQDMKGSKKRFPNIQRTRR